MAGKTADACTVGDYFGHLLIKKGEPQTFHHDHLISAPLLSLSLSSGIACFCKIRGKYGTNDKKKVVMTPIFFLVQYGKIERLGQMAQISALTTEKAPQTAPNVKGCPKSQSSIDLGHFLTLWLVPIWEVLVMQKRVL